MDRDDKWYKAKLQFLTIDEKTEKEKRTTVIYLVQAATLNGAVKNIDEIMGGTTIDYDVVSVNETQVMDVFEHHSNSAKHAQTVADDVPEYMKGE